MPQHRRLRRPGRTAGEQDDRRGIGIDRSGRPRTLAALAVALLDGTQAAIEYGNQAVIEDCKVAHAAGRVGPGDDRDGREPSDDLAQLVVAQAIVQRRERQSRERGTKERDRHDLGVHVDESDVFEFLGREPRRGAPSMLVKLHRGEPSVPRTEEHPFAGPLHRHLQQHAEVHHAPVARRLAVSPKRATAWPR